MSNFVKPTDAELKILHVLWNNGASSVRFVNEKLNELCGDGEEVVYTTTLKTMQVMHEKKNLLVRDDSARTHIYTAAVPQEETQKHMLRQFVDNTFKGSAMQLVMQALGDNSANEDELAEIKALIEKLENK
jgi:BlaI family transcriptional regulator, penicillinase repressor